MAITIDWSTRVINVPRNDLTLIQSSPTEIRELNLNSFRLELKDLEDSILGMVNPDTHKHNTEVSIGGLTYARVIEIINGYTITFEDGQYAVNLTGANSNVGDRVNVNQVSVRSQNSAGMTSSPDIEYSSFNGGVTYNPNIGINGTTFPIGTPRQPSGNILDAGLIAHYRGFNKGYIQVSLDMDGTVNMTDFILQGEGGDRTQINIQEAAVVTGCTFYDAHVTGTLDGNNRLTECLVTTLNYVNGFVERCALAEGTCTLGGMRTAYFFDCWGIATVNPHTVDFGGSGQGLVVRNYSGSMKLVNKSGEDYASIILLNGEVQIDLSTVTNGTIILRGNGRCINSVTGEYLSTGNYGDLILLNELDNTKETADSVWSYERT